MNILSMTATFGKLQHDTLTLKPGLNVVEAPNEWGKSTWCAFFTAMMYGLDTRAKTTKNGIADKEHYAPWSGLPMSGRMDILWQDRKITIERSTKGRIPMGAFKAYETETGMEIPQLTGENCGEMLLGAEQSVVKRAGFVSLRDLPVTRDEDLLKRLNGLVTTGDESGDGERLAKSLKDLKNKCRYNKKGLLPQAEEELKTVNQALEELKILQDQSLQTTRQVEEADREQAALQQHLGFLDAEDAADGEGKIAAARRNLEALTRNRDSLKRACSPLPTEQQIQEKQQKIRAFQNQWNSILEQEKQLPRVEMPPVAPMPFSGMTAQEAMETAQKDGLAFQKAQSSDLLIWILAAAGCTAVAMVMFLMKWIVPAIMLLGAAGGLLAWGLVQKKSRKDLREKLLRKYEDSDPKHWRQSADFYQRCVDGYQKEVETARKAREELDQKQERLAQQKKALCGELTSADALRACQEMLDLRRQYIQAKKDVHLAKQHLDSLVSLAKIPRKPAGEDSLRYTRQETEQKMEQNRQQHQNLIGRAGQLQGRMEALGTETQLNGERDRLQKKIRRLEDIYEASVLALSNLEEAAGELQRRFAPEISQRAQQFMSRMTDGRYQRLVLGDDFSLGTGAEGENVLHSVLWRSEGTIDQLYLSLRLAVWEVLTPEAPLVLDDALVRFDQQRLEKILEILQEAGREKQVILFTCQSREGQLLPGAVTHKV